MILFFGLFDLITVALSLASIYFSMYKGTTLIVLALLALKGFWSIGSSKTFFDIFGLIDLVGSIAVFLTLEFGLFTRFSLVMLCLLGWKSFMSIKPF